MISNAAALAAINQTVRHITAKVELQDGPTFTHQDALQSITVERTGEHKFFGFGICQKLSLKLRDVERSLSIPSGGKLCASFDGVQAFPTFTVTEVNRDENTNGLSITAYDAIYAAAGLTVADLGLTAPYTVQGFAEACAALMGLAGIAIVGVGSAETCFSTSYETGANFEGSESIRNALTAVAEATQTVYYVSADSLLTFKRLDRTGAALLTIDRSRYFTLSSKTNRRLGTIVNATELGDDVSASTTESGSTQYVRDNPFWDLREDVATLVDAALAAVGGLTINQFECEWRGNYLLELGDCIALETKDGGTATSYLLDDTISYDGTLSQRSQWNYADSEETASNPTNLGDAIKQTYARVDKANRQIDIVASETSENSTAIGALQVNTGSISASVESTQKYAEESVGGINDNLAELTNKVDAVITPEQVQLQIQTELDNGVSKVTTETGFTFDDNGLTVAKSDSEMATTISDDGMSITRSGEEVLRADNEGVKAEDLHATTYLIIGENSRLEDYSKDGEARTGCFWIGPTSI